MSYPLHKVSGGDAARTVRSDSGFWGLDLASPVRQRSFSLAMDTENLLWEGDALRVRPGFRSLAALSGRINGIFFYGEQMLIHAGTNFYCCAAEGKQPRLIYSEMNDAPSRGVLRNQTVTRRICERIDLAAWRREIETKDFLFISDGAHFLYYDGAVVRPMSDPYWGENIFMKISKEGVTSIEYSATVPFTTVAKLPDTGTGDTDPRGDNRLTQFRCESFYVDDSTTVSAFLLNCPYEAYHQKVPPELQLRDESGIWRNYYCADSEMVNKKNGLALLTLVDLTAGMPFSINEEGRIVNMTTGIHSLANDGLDNVRITYAVIKDTPDALTGATVQGLYGADGKDDVLFLTGSAAAPGQDAFSAPNDFFCFYETSVEQLGNFKAPITGYCRLSDGRLAVLKNESEGSNVFFRTHQLVSLGTTQSGDAYQVDAYPSCAGAAVEGCVTPHSVGVIDNEPCFLGRSGLYSVRSVSNELTNLNETVRRSLPIDPLLQTLPPEEARSIRWRTYYLITFGELGLISDGRRDGKGHYRFLKWRFPCPISALAQRGDKLYLGGEDGGVYVLDATDDCGESIPAFWHTPLMEAENGRRLILRRAWADLSPGYGGAVSARLFRDRCPEPDRRFALHLIDFGDWDFGAVSFEGNAEPRWVSLVSQPKRAAVISLRLDLTEGAALTLWGIRMIYEKGGMMR